MNPKTKVHQARVQYAAILALAALPNINLVRISCYTHNACYTANNPASYEDFVRYLTDRGIAVVIEHHDRSHTVPTGTALQQESSWYATLAAYYVNNLYVMFQTMNEPNTGDAAQMLATYYAIRNTGNNTVIFLRLGTGPEVGLDCKRNPLAVRRALIPFMAWPGICTPTTTSV